MSQGERKGSITTLRKWNLVAGGIDPRNDVIPASVGYGLEDALDFAMSEILRLQDRIKRLEDCAETAWGVIANVDNGSWGEQRADWREAAIRWRDEQFHLELSERKAKEAKP